MDIVEKCKSVLMKNEDIVFAYIFGSYVQGRIRRNSDIDIAIYLQREIEIDEYLNIKMNLTDICKREVDLVILNQATPLLKYQIYRNHILLFAKDKTMESNFKIKTLFEYKLFIAINMIVDIATHIVVDNNMGNPDTLGEAFSILNKEKYLKDDETKIYRNMVGLRNILSHEYLKIDKKIIYDVLKNNLKDFKKFIIFVNDNFI